jgi:uncharacterized membrane protein YfcA
LMLELFVMAVLLFGALLGVGWGMNALGMPLWAQIVWMVVCTSVGGWIGQEFRELRRDARERDEAGNDTGREGRSPK